ncbi:MAG TPA: hypothetical protein VM509_01905, partial [Planctomycetota bacterium]|nr:hypothetical protein [Planctomycetota bacterium]
MATLTVQRDKGWADKIRRYRILVDGLEIGRMAEGEVIRHTLTDGMHVIEARIDWCGSPPLQFEMLSTDKIVLIRSALRGWRLLF